MTGLFLARRREPNEAGRPSGRWYDQAPTAHPGPGGMAVVARFVPRLSLEVGFPYPECLTCGPRQAPGRSWQARIRAL